MAVLMCPDKSSLVGIRDFLRLAWCRRIKGTALLIEAGISRLISGGPLPVSRGSSHKSCSKGSATVPKRRDQVIFFVRSGKCHPAINIEIGIFMFLAGSQTDLNDVHDFRSVENCHRKQKSQGTCKEGESRSFAFQNISFFVSTHYRRLSKRTKAIRDHGCGPPVLSNGHHRRREY